MPLVMCLQYLRETKPRRVHLEGQLIDDGMHFIGGHLAGVLDFMEDVGSFEIFWNIWKMIRIFLFRRFYDEYALNVSI